MIRRVQLRCCMPLLSLSNREQQLLFQSSYPIGISDLNISILYCISSETGTISPDNLSLYAFTSLTKESGSSQSHLSKEIYIQRSLVGELTRYKVNHSISFVYLNSCVFGNIPIKFPFYTLSVADDFIGNAFLLPFFQKID